MSHLRLRALQRWFSRTIRIFLYCIIGCCYFAEISWGKQPNILLIVSDDAAYSDFGFTSELTNTPTQVETPNLDQLAQQSVVLSQGYVAASLCGPSRAGLLTGQYTQRYGNEENLGNSTGQITSSGTFGLAAEQSTIADHLRGLGYSTGLIGKWHEGYYDGLNRPLDKGFDEFYGILGGGRGYWADGTPERGVYRGNQFYEAQYRVEGDPAKYDPVMGRYFTDALGEEAVDFVNRHSAEENPFFLYLAFTAPHEPFQAKQVDLAHFSHISDPMRRSIAAQTYALDRSIGEVLDALEANGIDDETIVVFMNDNGALSYVFNPPYRGHKGTMSEGGIRVPFTIKAPGVQPGVYNGPVTALDVLPTLVAAGGGDLSQVPSDGYNVMPLLTGEETVDPHEVMFWRQFDAWAVRKGDWKLTMPFRDLNPILLFNIATDPRESFSRLQSNPAIAGDLLHELTRWESQMAKPRWGILSSNDRNAFDHFVYVGGQATAGNWSAPSVWQQSGTTTTATLQPTDAYANAIIEFGVRDDRSYTATNDMRRGSRMTFMLNQLRLTGDFAGTANQAGTLNGNAVLFVNDLNGTGPRIQLDATGSEMAAKFRFNIDHELQLFHDLEIGGNGNQEFFINGRIADYYEVFGTVIPTRHNVTKTGTSHVTLTGKNTFTGTLAINEGRVTLDGASAAIDGAAGVVIGAAGEFTLASGTVAVQTLDNSAGGTFDFHGGTLTAHNVAGDLVNDGGTFAPGASSVQTTIDGDFTQNAGKLQLQIGGTSAGSQFDQIDVTGVASLGASLEVKLIDGFTPAPGQAFEVIRANGGILGEFDNFVLPMLSSGNQWDTITTPTSFSLTVIASGDSTGDYNGNGVVDAADYTVWRDTFGQSVTPGAGADGNRNGEVDQLDYNVWKTKFGQIIAAHVASSDGVVPEPAAIHLTFGLALLSTLAWRRCGTTHKGRKLGMVIQMPRPRKHT